MTTKNGFRPRALGEIAIRCTDMAAMVAFYEGVIGLTLLRGGPEAPITFFRIGEGFGGHTTVLALFDARTDPLASLDTGKTRAVVTGNDSSLHHIALSLPYGEQAAVMDWYDRIEQPYHVEEFDWVGWRGIFTRDPEGNTVELVAYDASLLAGSAQ